MATLRKIAAAFGARLDVNLVERSTSSSEPAAPSSGRLLKLLSPLFWDRELQATDLQRYQGWVLERVLMFGNWRQVVAARQFYGDEATAHAAERRGVDGRTRNFWNTILSGETIASESA